VNNSIGYIFAVLYFLVILQQTRVSQVFESTYYINVSRSAEIDMQPNSEADTGVAVRNIVFM